MHTITDALATQLPGFLGAELVGIYVYGSLVWGDFDADISDIDTLVVLTRDVDDGLFAVLNAFHQELEAAFPEWQGRIEIAYIAQAALQTFRVQRSPIAVISPGEPFNIKDAGLDWLINWYTIRTQGVVVYGPQVTDIIPVITAGEFRTAVGNQISEWVEWVHEAGDQSPSHAYVILTMCRALYSVATGHQTSKIQAAAWANIHHPSQAVRIEKALRWRRDWRAADPAQAAESYADAVAMVEYASRAR
ncbi:MAG: hypothetical protein RLY87_861 [Chloroflexota bacterium]|jgi:predicted nucleotidyltransferase